MSRSFVELMTLNGHGKIPMICKVASYVELMLKVGFKTSKLNVIAFNKGLNMFFQTLKKSYSW